MGKRKPADLPTPTLITFQTMLGMANEQMDQFATALQDKVREGRVRASYYKEVIDKLKPKIDTNNKALNEIEHEIAARIKKDFPGTTTPDYMSTLYKQYFEEEEAYAKLNSKVEVTEKPKGKTLNLHTDKKKDE